MFFTLLIVIIAIIAILLMVVVLLQSGKGGGLAGVAAGGATRQVLGARQAPDFLERITWTLAAVFVMLCILTNFAIDTGGNQESVIEQRAGQTAPTQTAPPGGNDAQPLDQGTQPAPAPSENDGSGQ